MAEPVEMPLDEAPPPRESPPPAPGPPPAARGHLVRAAVAIALAVGVYAQVLYYMVLHWKAVDDYSHGFLIVPLALYFVWERRGKIDWSRIQPSWSGLLPLTLGVLALAIGRLGVELTSMRTGFVLTLIGLVLLLLGRHVFRTLAFPLLFLFLMVPLPQSLVNVVAFPLQLIAAQFAVSSLHLLQIPALLEGNIIHLANAQLFVADACSGLRSLMALITLGVVFAYFFRKRLVERVIIVLSAIPIAILVNALRVALTGYLTHRFGEQAASGVIHEFQGLITFALAFVLLMFEASLLSKLWPEGGRARRKEST
ncbi:MAG: exosortase/archaeosortase family protein [Proteobacteria bacterium]|nr:exosortase/archaeosortase family protein [Pseudomonadota bacterium]